MMPNKKKILLDGIKKLLALKVPEEEIISNLKDVGISEKQARALIEEVRLGKRPKEEEPEEESRGKKFENKEEPEEQLVSEEDAQAEALEKEYLGEEEKPEDINVRKTIEETEELAEEEAQSIFEKKIENTASEEKNSGVEEESFESETGKPEEETSETVEEEPEEESENIEYEETKGKIVEGKFSSKNKDNAEKEGKKEDIDFEKLWEKGILTIVNQRLQEMKGIQANIDLEIQKRASEIAKKEIDKVNALFEGQRELTVETVNSKLEQKTRDLGKMLDAKVLELKEISKSVKNDIARLEKLQQAQKDSLKQIDERLGELDETKKTLIAEMNSELIKSKSEIEEFLDSSNKKVQETQAMINETLELESSIVDGLVKDTETKISASKLERENASAKKFEAALDALEIARAGFEQQAAEKIAEIEKQLKLLKKSTVKANA
jgi:hypothetical protein